MGENNSIRQFAERDCISDDARLRNAWTVAILCLIERILACREIRNEMKTLTVCQFCTRITAGRRAYVTSNWRHWLRNSRKTRQPVAQRQGQRASQSTGFTVHAASRIVVPGAATLFSVSRREAPVCVTINP